MSPRLRKLALTAHVVSSVGWLGAVLAFLALAVIGLASSDAQRVRGVYLVMEPAAWLVLVPLAFATLLTGIVSALGTRWGLLRYRWVVVKLVMALLATLILLVYMETFSQMAAVAADPGADLRLVRNPSPVLHAVLALLVLLAATILGIYKPWGLTRFGRRKRRERRASGTGAGGAGAAGAAQSGVDGDRPRLARVLALGLGIILLLLFVALHLLGRIPTH